MSQCTYFLLLFFTEINFTVKFAYGKSMEDRNIPWPPLENVRSILNYLTPCFRDQCRDALSTLYFMKLRKITVVFPRCIECQRRLAMRKVSVGLSVCQTRGLWQNGRKICPDFLPRCMECRCGLAMRILSVRLSVRPSVCHTRELWQNGRKICLYLYTIRKII